MSVNSAFIIQHSSLRLRVVSEFHFESSVESASSAVKLEIRRRLMAFLNLNLNLNLLLRPHLSPHRQRGGSPLSQATTSRMTLNAMT
jgi:hypothetical protein